MRATQNYGLFKRDVRFPYFINMDGQGVYIGIYKSNLMGKTVFPFKYYRHKG